MTTVDHLARLTDDEIVENRGVPFDTYTREKETYD